MSRTVRAAPREWRLLLPERGCCDPSEACAPRFVRSASLLCSAKDSPARGVRLARQQARGGLPISCLHVARDQMALAPEQPRPVAHGPSPSVAGSNPTPRRDMTSYARMSPSAPPRCDHASRLFPSAASRACQTYTPSQHGGPSRLTRAYLVGGGATRTTGSPRRPVPCCCCCAPRCARSRRRRERLQSGHRALERDALQREVRAGEAADRQVL